MNTTWKKPKVVRTLTYRYSIPILCIQIELAQIATWDNQWIAYGNSIPMEIYTKKKFLGQQQKVYILKRKT